MKKIVSGIILSSLLLTSGSVLAANYKFDKEGQHAFINFRVQHLGYSWVYGTFRDFDGSFTYDEKNPANNKVEVTINTNSVESNHAERDKHIRSDTILDVAKFPQSTFKSTSVEMGKDGQMKITGDLTLHGVTKPITLDAQLMGQGKDPWGKDRAGFNATGTIVLKDFDIKQDLGPASRTAEIIISIEGIKQ